MHVTRGGRKDFPFQPDRMACSTGTLQPSTSVVGKGKRRNPWRLSAPLDCGFRSSRFLHRMFYLVAFVVHLSTSAIETNELGQKNATDDAAKKPTSVEVCQMDTFVATCPKDNQIIIVHEAKLGILWIGGCISEGFGYLGCSLNVLPELDVYCSGRRRCEVRVDDQSFKRKAPGCHKDLKNHLLVSYACIEVVVPSRGTSCEPIEATSGFISSHVTETTGCGLSGTPWVIQLGQGLRINVTLYDFSHDYDELTSSTGVQSFPRTCRVYATIRDSSSEVRSLKVCGWQNRVAHVYMSTGNRIEIRIMSGKTTTTTMTRQGASSSMPSTALHQAQLNPQFLIHFQAVGCSDMVVPDDMAAERTGDHQLTVRCHGSDRSWQLVCQENKWIGSYGNCEAENLATASGLHFAASTIILVVIAAVVSSLILIVGIFCIKWRKRESENARSFQLTMTDHYNGGDYSLDTITPDKLTPDSAQFAGVPPVDGSGNEYARMRIMCLPQYDVKGSPPPGYDLHSRYGMPIVEHIYESPDCLSGRSPDGGRLYTSRIHQPMPPGACHDDDAASRVGSVASAQQHSKVNMTQTRSTNQRQSEKGKNAGNYSL